MESSPKSSKSIKTFFGKCRCCLDYGYMKSMWSEYERDGLREIYGEMLMETFSVTWQSLDETQDYICEPCVVRLQDAYDFKKEVLASELLMYENIEELNEDESFNVEMLDYYEELEDHGQEQEHVQEDNVYMDKASASETEYYEVEYLEDEIESNEALSPKILKAETIADEKKREEKCGKKKNVGQLTRGVYKQYSDEDIKLCLEAVKDNSMSVSEACQFYTVPRRALLRRLNYEQKKKTDLPQNKTCEKRKPQQIPVVKKHRANLLAVLEYSNATPFKSQTGMFFTCNYCQKPFTQPRALKEHTLELHEDVSKAANIKVAFGFSIKLDITDLRCDLCGEHIILLEDLMTHLAYEHDILIHTDVTTQMVPYKFDGKEMKCAVCSRTFTFFKMLAEHMSEHYRNYECELCGAPFINKQRYKMHKERHKTGVFFCDFCPKSFDNKLRKRDHERVVHVNNGKTCRCSYCVEKFVNIAQKLAHEKSVHGGAYRIFTCHECGEMFYDNRALSRHTKKFHIVLKSYKCSECNMAFHKKSSLIKHLKKHTYEYLCTVCDQKFLSELTAKEHIKECHENVPC